MKALRLFSMAALALVMAACAKEANFSNEPERQSGMHFSATLSAPNSGADTKTVYTQDGTTIHVAWKKGDEIAVIFNGVKDVVAVTKVDAITGAATIEGTITSNPEDDDYVLMYYPAAVVSGIDEFDKPVFDYSKWESQDGTLAYIQDHLDVRHATPQVTVSGSDVTLQGSVSMESDAAIWKLRLENNAKNELSAIALKVRVGGTTVAAATSASPTNEYYIGLIPKKMGTGDLAIDAKVGTDTYRYMKASGVTLDDSKYYESTVAMMNLLNTPLTIEAITEGTIVVRYAPSGMKYSLNGGDKILIDTAVDTMKLAVGAGDKVAFYGNGDIITSYSHPHYLGTFGGTAKAKVYGNIMSLVNETNFASAKTVPEDQAFGSLFSFYASLTDASGLLLSATTLSKYCYGFMFWQCNNLTAAPELLATTTSIGCCYGMFVSCTSLTEAPELPATVLADDCYNMMFYDCFSLKDVPNLPAMELKEECYENMFTHCTSLTEAKKLPATELANGCYAYMFANCTGLKDLPNDMLPAMELKEDCYKSMFECCTGLTSLPDNFLPATVLESACYNGMFNGCTGLMSLPNNLLPAENLVAHCYASMFSGCTGLTSLPNNFLPATKLSYACYIYMFYGCTSLTTAPKLPATKLEKACYESMFLGCTSLNSVTCLATDISADYCTTDWLDGVATSGTFTKASTMSSWTTGTSGIPSGWEVKDYNITP